MRYLRNNNTPSQLALHAKLAALEGAEAALVTRQRHGGDLRRRCSALLSAGDHLLAQSCLYGGTHDLLTREFPRLGLGADFIDAHAARLLGGAAAPAARAPSMSRR